MHYYCHCDLLGALLECLRTNLFLPLNLHVGHSRGPLNEVAQVGCHNLQPVRHQLAYGLSPSTHHCHTSWDIFPPSSLPPASLQDLCFPSPIRSPDSDWSTPLTKKKGGGATSRKKSWLVTALTDYVWQSPAPPPRCPLLSYTMELLLHPGGNVFVSPFLKGGVRGSW